MRQFQLRRLSAGLLIILWIWSLPLAAQEILQIPQIALEHYHQGVFYGKNGKYVEATLELEKAIEAYPDYADAYNALAVVYHHQQEHQQAIENYRHAIEIDSQHVKARTNLALVYQEQGQYALAAAQLEEALRIDPSYAAAQQVLPKVRTLLDDQKAAEARAEENALAASREKAAAATAITVTTTPSPSSSARSASKSPPSPPSLFERGTAYIRQGKIDAGIEAYRQGLLDLPCSAEGLTLLGMAYREKFRDTQHLEWQQEEMAAFQKAIQCDPAYVPAILALAETFYAQRDYANAERYFRYVLQFQPDHPARKQIEEFLNR